MKLVAKFETNNSVISSLTGLTQEAGNFEIKGKYQTVPGGPGGAVPFDALPYCRYHHKF